MDQDKSVRPGGPGVDDVTVEIEVEARIELEPLAVHVDDMDFVVALSLHDSPRSQGNVTFDMSGLRPGARARSRKTAEVRSNRGLDR
jgi:hypothetical protein